MNEAWGYSEKKFHLHHDMAEDRWAWFDGDKRESDWFTSTDDAKKWNSGSARSIDRFKVDLDTILSRQ